MLDFTYEQKNPKTQATFALNSTYLADLICVR